MSHDPLLQTRDHWGMLPVKNTPRRKGIKAELQEILEEIMEQAEARYKEWEYREA